LLVELSIPDYRVTLARDIGIIPDADASALIAEGIDPNGGQLTTTVPFMPG
jgi:hypothetical protein